MVGPSKTESETSKAARLSNELLRSRDHVENVGFLINIIEKSSNDGPLKEAVLSLHAFFLLLLRSGEIQANKNVSDGKERARGDVGTGDWLKKKYLDYVRAAMGLLGNDGVSPALQRLIVDSLMEYVKEERSGSFSNSIFFELCRTLVNTAEVNPLVLAKLNQSYFIFCDVRCYLYSNVQRLVQQRQKLGVASDDGHTFARSVYRLLSSVPPPPLEDTRTTKDKGGAKRLALPAAEEGGGGGGQSMRDTWSVVRVGQKRKKTEAEGLDSPPSLEQQRKNRKNKGRKGELKAAEAAVEDESESVPGKWGVKAERKLLQGCWLSFLHLSLPLDVYKNVLAGLQKTLIAHMPNPLLLSDFLTDSYNCGGLISVLSLNALLTLMTQHGLEYPSFYNKLYAMVDGSIFMARHRARFFQLLDVCLNSSHLPAYIAAAFAKRVSRVALHGPPSGALVAIALVHNLLRRHPSINVLVHSQPSFSVAAPAQQSHLNVVANAGDGRVSENTAVLPGTDPFDSTEPDTAKCRALESSLWELETLRSHYCPAVSRFVASLETDLTERAKTTEVSIADFSSGSYGTILTEEANRRLKQVPLAFYSTTPKSLFAQNMVSPGSTDGGSDFPGWVFK